MVPMLARLMDAMNSRDAGQMASLFADTYESAQPVHPARAFRGRAHVLANWSSVFEGVPDFTAELVASAIDGETEWGEWDWRGRYTDGTPFAMRGVTILLAHDGLITRMHLYLDPSMPAAETSTRQFRNSIGHRHRAKRSIARPSCASRSLCSRTQLAQGPA